MRSIILNCCYDCIWRKGEECHYHKDENGNPELIEYEPTDCKDFAEE